MDTELTDEELEAAEDEWRLELAVVRAKAWAMVPAIVAAVVAAHAVTAAAGWLVWMWVTT